MQYKDAYGLTVTRVSRQNEDVVLTTLPGEPNIRMVPMGDCCSMTWIEGVDLLESLYGKILKIEDINMPDQGNKGTLNFPGVDCVRYYGLRVTTTKGIAVFDYRNSSNGYYGGYISFLLEKKSA